MGGKGNPTMNKPEQQIKDIIYITLTALACPFVLPIVTRE